MVEIINLTGLSPREAVADALYRCVRGLDTNDMELFTSSFVKDDSLVVTAGPIGMEPLKMEGWAAFGEFFEKGFRVTTSHLTSNVRVELKEGADTAYMTANAVAYHIRPEDALKQEDTSYTSACLYEIDLVKDSADGLWKMKRWDLKIQWTTGDMAVLHG